MRRPCALRLLPEKRDYVKLIRTGGHVCIDHFQDAWAYYDAASHVWHRGASLEHSLRLHRCTPQVNQHYGAVVW